MRIVIVTALLLQILICDGSPTSHFKVYTAVYCPLKKEWEWRATLAETDPDGPVEWFETNHKIKSKNQLQFTMHEGNVNDGNDEAELDVVINHTCTSDGSWKYVSYNREADIDISSGDSFMFKALHLGRPAQTK